MGEELERGILIMLSGSCRLLHVSKGYLPVTGYYFLLVIVGQHLTVQVTTFGDWYQYQHFSKRFSDLAWWIYKELKCIYCHVPLIGCAKMAN